MAWPVPWYQSQRWQDIEQFHEAGSQQGCGCIAYGSFCPDQLKERIGSIYPSPKSSTRSLKSNNRNCPKLARLVYSMLKNGTTFTDAGQDYYEERYRTRVVQNLKRKAQEMGFKLVSIQEEPQTA
jgi:hypothetical protein